MASKVITTRVNELGFDEYHIEYDSTWDGFDSFVGYLQNFWQADVVESVDEIYSRRWVLRLQGVPVSVYYDSQVGIHFTREDESLDHSVLEKVKEDLIHRFGQ